MVLAGELLIYNNIGERMKKSITVSVIIASLFFSGCSAKNGAIVGGTTGAIAGGLIGAGLSQQHTGNGNTAQGALQVGLALGLVGALIGAGTGYVSDEVTKEKDKEIQDIMNSNKQIEEIAK